MRRGATAEEAVSLARSLRPDVVLLDLSLPVGGLSALPALRLLAGVAVAVLTSSEDSDDLTNALSAGAAGYIVKGVGGRTLIDAVRTIARGEGYVTPTVAARVISEMGARRKDEPSRMRRSAGGTSCASAGPAHPEGVRGAEAGGRGTVQQGNCPPYGSA